MADCPFYVIHDFRSSTSSGPGSPEASLDLDGTPLFRFDTCQRRLWVSDNLDSELIEDLRERKGLTVYSGEAGYEFLLRVTTGLESKLQGETNVFGQFKDAWKRFTEKSPHPSLIPIIQKLFEDTKDIRTEFLQDIGTPSYGSLVRDLLKKRIRSPQESILLLGAGDIAHTVAPWLLNKSLGELQLLNRDHQRLLDLETALKAKNHENHPILLLQKDEELSAIVRATHLVLCIPFDEVRDEARVRARIEARKDKTASVIHLGGNRAAAGIWKSLTGFFALDDLLQTQEIPNERRAIQLERAGRECLVRAKLRQFGGSLSTAHGWEYLQAF